MRALLLGIVLGAALLVYAAAHVVLCAGLLRGAPRWRGALALVIPPLAPLWGWKGGRRGWVYAWLAALGVYAAGVIVAAL